MGLFRTHKRKILGLRKPVLIMISVDKFSPGECNAVLAMSARLIKTLNPAARIGGGWSYTEAKKNEPKANEENLKNIQSLGAARLAASAGAKVAGSPCLGLGGDLENEGH